MFMSKIKVAAAVVLAVGIFATGAGVFMHQLQVAAQTPAKETVQTPAADKKKDALTLEELAARATAIKPSERELTWLKTPWVLNLIDAQKMAKEERRPIFLWVTGDDPLGRC